MDLTARTTTPARFVAAALLAALFSAFASGAAAPVRLVFDTDMGNDVDDALALAMIHALETRGEAQLLAVTLSKDNRYAAPFVDLVSTFYGRKDIPIGVVKEMARCGTLGRIHDLRVLLRVALSLPQPISARLRWALVWDRLAHSERSAGPTASQRTRTLKCRRSPLHIAGR
jgi:hypothetical protein